LARGVVLQDALANAVGRVGGTLAASAATVICGIGTLVFARFGKYHQAGICIPFALTVVLASALTFGPTLLRLTGSWAFWPRRSALKPGPPEKLPTDADDQPSRNRRQTNIWEGIARALLARPGTIWLASLAAMAPFVVIAVIHYKELDYGISTEIPKTAPSWAGTKILKDHFAAGVTGPTTVLLTNHQVYFGSL